MAEVHGLMVVHQVEVDDVLGYPYGRWEVWDLDLVEPRKVGFVYRCGKWRKEAWFAVDETEPGSTRYLLGRHKTRKDAVLKLKQEVCS